MKKVLLPIDGSVRSLRTIEMVKQLYEPTDVEFTIIMVMPGLMHVDSQLSLERLWRKTEQELQTFAELLPGYEVKTVLLHGSPGPEIVGFAKDGGFDTLVMTRSTRGPLRKLGSVAVYIVRNAPFLNLLIMQEEKTE